MIDRQLILESFRTVRTNTIQVARDIPAEKYDFRPAEGTFTVLEMFKNLLRLTEFMTAGALSRETYEITPANRDEIFRKLAWTDPKSVTTKDQVVDALVSSMAEIEKRVMAADEDFLNSTFVAPDKRTKIRLWVIQNAKEQEMATRAQLFLVERLLGIVPHTTRRQQEREREAAAAGAKQP